jgi:hypothetical protein
MYGEDFNPIIKAAENAVRMQSIADDAQKKLKDNDVDVELKIAISSNEFNQRKECVAAWDKIGQYVTPRLKAVEVVDEEGNNALPKFITINVVDPSSTDTK